MSLFFNVHDVEADELSYNQVNPEDRVSNAKSHDMQLVYGNEAALAISHRKPGYHSAPHIHDFEQLNYIGDGEMWFYVEDKGYHCKKGDFLRIPRNVIHWSWVKTEEPCLCYEVFSPVPPVSLAARRKGRGLFAEDEVPAVRDSIGVFYVDPQYHGLDVEAIEAAPAVNRSASELVS